MTIAPDPPAVTAPLASPITPGPGVVPPFAAPPREGNRRRLWLGLGIGSAVLVLCCGGGVIGLGAFLVSSTQAQRDEARQVVTQYMTAWQKQDYPGAYQLLCDDEKATTPLASFAGVLSETQVENFVVGNPTLQTATTQVPVQITFADGDVENNEYRVIVDRNQDSKLCGSE